MAKVQRHSRSFGHQSKFTNKTSNVSKQCQTLALKHWKKTTGQVDLYRNKLMNK